jgi:uroporphyrinogen-III synthase
MADEFPDHEGKVIYLAAENSRRGPIDALEADFVPLYSTVLLEPAPPEGDVVVLASGSAARAYAFVGGSAPAISIGPETTRVADTVGIEVVGEAKTHDLDGLVAAVAEYAASVRR